MTILLQELGTLNGGLEPLLTGLHGVVEFREHPYFAALQPDELIGVVNRAVAVEAGEVATELGVLGFVEPEGDHAKEELRAILLR